MNVQGVSHRVTALRFNSTSVQCQNSSVRPQTLPPGLGFRAGKVHSESEERTHPGCRADGGEKWRKRGENDGDGWGKKWKACETKWSDGKGKRESRNDKVGRGGTGAAGKGRVFFCLPCRRHIKHCISMQSIYGTLCDNE